MLSSLTSQGDSKTYQFPLFPLLGWSCSYVPNSCRVEKNMLNLSRESRERERGGDKYILREISLFLVII